MSNTLEAARVKAGAPGDLIEDGRNGCRGLAGTLGHEVEQIEIRRQRAAVLAEQELEEVEPDRLPAVSQEVPSGMIAKIRFGQHPSAEVVKATLALPAGVGKAELLPQYGIDEVRTTRPGLQPSKIDSS
jgi:hypothetical protein